MRNNSTEFTNFKRFMAKMEFAKKKSDEEYKKHRKESKRDKPGNNKTGI